MKRIIATWDEEKRAIPIWDNNKTRTIHKKCIQYHFSNEDKVLAFCNCTLQAFWDGVYISELIRNDEKIRMKKYENIKQSLETAELFLECIDVDKIKNKQNFFRYKTMLEGQWYVYNALSLKLRNLLSEKIPNGK